MAEKLHRFRVSEEPSDANDVMAFVCPGCQCSHPYDLARWQWNGSLDKPTFTPSLLVFASDPAKRCHLFMTEGKIHFLDDCFHALKGQTVDCPPWDDDKF